jgi:hypothetical protein
MADEAPKSKNKIYPLMPGGSIDKAYVQRYVRDMAEIEDMAKRGYALPKEGGKDAKYWTAVDEPNTSYPKGTRLVRVARENVLPDRAVRAEHVELHDPETGKWGAVRGGRGESGAGSLLRAMNPQKLYKKGGTVKSASSRADGVAQRGKTRGRMV